MTIVMADNWWLKVRATVAVEPLVSVSTSIFPLFRIGVAYMISIWSFSS